MLYKIHCHVGEIYDYIPNSKNTVYRRLFIKLKIHNGIECFIEHLLINLINLELLMKEEQLIREIESKLQLIIPKWKVFH